PHAREIARASALHLRRGSAAFGLGQNRPGVEGDVANTDKPETAFYGINLALSCPGTPMARIDAFFKLMSEQKASDLHLSTNNPPMLRINGDLIRVDYSALKDEELKTMVYEIASETKIKHFEENLDVDFVYEVSAVARHRVNFFQQKCGIPAVC